MNGWLPHASKKHLIFSWIICSIGALFYCYEYLLRIAPSLMSTELMRDYHLTAAQYGDASAFFYYAYAPLQLVVGVLVDRYGPRRLLMWACALCVLGSFLFASTHYFPVLILSRFLIGFGSAFAFVGALKLVTVWLPPRRFAFAAGLVGMLGMFGAMIGDNIITKLLEWYDWRMASFTLGKAGIIVIFLIFFLVRDRNPEHSYSETNTSFGSVLSGLKEALRSRNLWINSIVGLFLYLSLSAFAELWGVPYLIQARHLTQMDAAAMISMVFLGWAIGAPLVGWLSDQLSVRRIFLIAGSFISAILISIIIYLPIYSATVLTALLFLFGLASSAEMLIFAVGREVSPEHVAGTALAFTNMVVMIGGILFQPMIGFLLDLDWQGTIVHGVRIFSVHNYQVALSVLPISFFVATLLGFWLCETHCRPLS